MSDALDYLLKARPEAMGHYFQFVGSAGKHLDPKTRALISVITKVHAQTEAGFRQYLRRALKADVRPIEILDAMLMAFPALGLTKIVWAIDVLLAMDLPEFRLDALTAQPNWHRLGAADSFEIAQTVRVEGEGRSVFVHRTAQEYRVFDTRCPHRGTIIPESALEGTGLICPRHGWIFDAHDGRCVEGEGAGLIRLPSRIEDGELQARW
jgi:nitrite reductase/ring-hydroxylating ferredoxin subunit/alkylhydroperoxidase/carboxymuconolactone decarboxylase family protein YurZ